MTVTAVSPSPRVSWRAGNDRVSHAHVDKALRTMCGSEIVAERLAWPAFRKCLVCRAALEPVPETEQRLMAGDR